MSAIELNARASANFAAKLAETEGLQAWDRGLDAVAQRLKG